MNPKRWLQAFFCLALLGGLFVLREPLRQWFNPRAPLPKAQHHHGDGAAPTQPFKPEVLTALKKLFAAYELLRIELANDSVDGLAGASAEALSALAVVPGAAHSETTKNALAQAAQSVEALANQTDVEAARAPFGNLSEAVFRLAETDPRLRQGWRSFHCPMAKGFQKWLQKPEAIENPYMGQAMLACGSASDWATQQPEADPPRNADAVAYHTCSMHPSVREHAPGLCPICNMNLTPVTHEALRTGDVLVDSVRRQRIGVRTALVERRHLSRSIRAVGRITWDESLIHDVTARVDGWVEGLAVKRLGDPVAKGAPLLRFYSPELFATQREMLAAAPHSALAASAAERLRLAGMSAPQIATVRRRGAAQKRVTLHSPISGIVLEKRVNEGAHIRAGALLFRIVDRRKVWVEVDVFEQDLPSVKVGQAAQVQLPQVPGKTWDARIAYIYPSLDARGRTGKLRIELANSDGVLRPEMLADVVFEVDLGERLAVPTAAVLFTGIRRLVFIDKGEGKLRPVEVQLGPQAGDWTAVLEGLVEGDSVVTSGAFLLAAESRLRSATKYWEPSGD